LRPKPPAGWFRRVPTRRRWRIRPRPVCGEFPGTSSQRLVLPLTLEFICDGGPVGMDSFSLRVSLLMMLQVHCWTGVLLLALPLASRHRPLCWFRNWWL